MPGSSNTEHAQGAPTNHSVLLQSANDGDAFDRPTSAGVDGAGPGDLHRSDSQSQTYIPSRGGTLKKKASIKRTTSFGRSASRRNSQAGSVRSVNLGDKAKDEQNSQMNSVFYTPVPTTGSPTELLATRFQCMWTVNQLRESQVCIKLC